MKPALTALRGYPRHLLAAALASGFALSMLPSTLLFALAGLCVILVTAVRLPAHVAIAAGALLLLGAGFGAARLAAIDSDPLARLPRSEITLHGFLVDLPSVDQNGARMRVREIRTGQLVQIRSRAAPPPLTIGDELSISGKLRPVDPRAVREGPARDFARHLLRVGVRRQMTVAAVTSTGAQRAGLIGAVDDVRRRAERALALGLAPEPAALLRGMVLGGDAGLRETTADAFRVAGLSHILAVSGQNVLLIVILVQAILTACGAGRRARIAVAAVVIVIYVLLCGAQASVIRAGAMGLAALVALAASRPSSRIYALILAAIVVLAWNPRATADVGAQLSFAAVLGIMAFTEPLAGRLARLPRWTAEAFAATAGATLATAPLMAYHFEAVSLVSLAANVLGEPLIGPIVWIGSLTAAIGQFSVGLAALLGAPNSFLLGTLIELAHAAARVPGAQVEAGGLGLTGLMAGLALVVATAAVAHGWVPRPPARPMAALCAAAILALVAPFGGADSIDGPAIAMVDVGQGDATLLVGSGCSALIDTGPPGERLEQKLRGLGVRRLDALLITHPEDDHFGGGLELARDGDVPVGVLLDGGGNTPRADYAELRERFAATGSRTIPAVAGARWSCPGVAIEVIGPTAQPPGALPPDNPNERAAVTQVTVGGIRMFASGDAESPQLLGLPLATADVFKVPHHGSDDPGLSAVLARIRPRVALIGVGAHNRYGHPTPQTLGALAASGVSVLRTDRGGTIVLRPTGEHRLRVERGG